jgi:hypothetical protein
MRWRKLGKVFSAEGQLPWMASHAQNPFAEQIEGNLYRIYFAPRDVRNRSYVGWLEIDITRPDRILQLAETPLVAPGDKGSFDDAGAMMSCLVTHGENRYLYYIGWNLRTTAPYHLSIGLALGSCHARTPKVTKLPEPIIDRSSADPFFCTSPGVLVENRRWRMWYLSGVSWPTFGGRMTPSYDIRYGESHDGIDWRCTGQVVLSLGDEEVGFSRPCVISEYNGYSMWYSVRGRDHRYRLGFARSENGLVWTREDANSGLEPSIEGWDSDMIAYPHVFNHGTERYMLYCGNEYGRTGFGLAVCER